MTYCVISTVCFIFNQSWSLPAPLDSPGRIPIAAPSQQYGFIVSLILDSSATLSWSPHWLQTPDFPRVWVCDWKECVSFDFDSLATHPGLIHPSLLATAGIDSSTLQ